MLNNGLNLNKCGWRWRCPQGMLSLQNDPDWGQKSGSCTSFCWTMSHVFRDRL